MDDLLKFKPKYLPSQVVEHLLNIFEELILDSLKQGKATKVKNIIHFHLEGRKEFEQYLRLKKLLTMCPLVELQYKKKVNKIFEEWEKIDNSNN